MSQKEVSIGEVGPWSTASILVGRYTGRAPREDTVEMGVTQPLPADFREKHLPAPISNLLQRKSLLLRAACILVFCDSCTKTSANT